MRRAGKIKHNKKNEACTDVHPQNLMFYRPGPIRQVDAREDSNMTIKSRVTQDRRNTSRVMARLDCSFTLKGTRYEAVIVDLSMKGAFLSSPFLPSTGSIITIELGPPAVKEPLSFECTVLRGTWVMADHGKRGRFSIRFGSSNPELMLLISKYHS
jgi:hypothetical protein